MEAIKYPFILNASSLGTNAAVVSYTEAELLNLKNLLTRQLTGYPSYVCVKVTRRDKQIEISEDTFDNILYRRPFINIDEAVIEVVKIVHFTVLDEVPMHINDYPEIAGWRLRLGK